MDDVDINVLQVRQDPEREVAEERGAHNWEDGGRYGDECRGQQEECRE